MKLLEQLQNIIGGARVKMSRRNGTHGSAYDVGERCMRPGGGIMWDDVTWYADRKNISGPASNAPSVG